MRINELTPYRKNPYYKKAREIFTDPETGPIPKRKNKLRALTACFSNGASGS